MRFCAQRVVGFRHDMDVQLHWMICAMQMKDSVYRQPLVLAEIKVAGYMCGAKSDLWIFCAFENVLLHFLISRSISALPAFSLDCNQAVRRFRDRIEMNDAAVERESTLGGVEDGLQGPMDGGFCRIKGHRNGCVRIRLRSHPEWQNQEAGEYDTRGDSLASSFLMQDTFHSFSVNKGLPQGSSSQHESPDGSQIVAYSARQHAQRAVVESSPDGWTMF